MSRMHAIKYGYMGCYHDVVILVVVICVVVECTGPLSG